MSSEPPRAARRAPRAVRSPRGPGQARCGREAVWAVRRCLLRPRRACRLSTGDRGRPVTRVGAAWRRVGGVVAAWWRHGGGASGCRGVQRCARGAKASLLLRTAQTSTAARRRATGASCTIDGAAWLWLIPRGRASGGMRSVTRSRTEFGFSVLNTKLRDVFLFLRGLSRTRYGFTQGTVK